MGFAPLISGRPLVISGWFEEEIPLTKSAFVAASCADRPYDIKIDDPTMAMITASNVANRLLWLLLPCDDEGADATGAFWKVSSIAEAVDDPPSNAP